jgi:hypothetical protein
MTLEVALFSISFTTVSFPKVSDMPEILVELVLGDLIELF